MEDSHSEKSQIKSHISSCNNSNAEDFDFKKTNTINQGQFFYADVTKQLEESKLRDFN